MSNLQNKVILVTGASSGIGKAIAEKAAEHGAKIVLAARREEKLKEIANGIKERGGEAIYKTTDVSKKSKSLI